MKLMMFFRTRRSVKNTTSMVKTGSMVINLLKLRGNSLPMDGILLNNPEHRARNLKRVILRVCSVICLGVDVLVDLGEELVDPDEEKILSMLLR